MAIKKIQKDVINEFVLIHGDTYDYDQVNYINMHTHIDIICKKHGLFSQQPRAHKAGQGCPKCRISVNWVPTRNTVSFIKRAIEVHGDKYDYSQTKYYKTMGKILIICPYHGKFKQLANSHLNGRGCPKCAGNSIKSLEKFIEDAQKLHGTKYDYSCSNYTNSTTKMIIICRKHGAFYQKPLQHLSGQGCPKCGIEAMKQSLKKEEKIFISECRTIHDNKYDYSKVIYNSRASVLTIICLKHGEFKQRASEHLRGYGCPQCAGNQLLTTEEFIDKAIKTHNNRYDYTNSIYTRSKDSITISCKKHGNFNITAGYHLQGGGCPTCSLSTQQSQILEFIKSKTNQPIISNDRTAISPFELDIFLPTSNFAVEFNGNFYHSYNHLETTEERQRHKNKADMAKKNNIKLIQINSHEWKNKQELVKSMILHRLGLSSKIHGRKCVVKNIINKKAKEFFEVCHISGHRAAKLNYGLYFEDNLVSVINLTQIKQGEWEIIRYASLAGIMVVGGLSKMLAQFIKTHHPKIVHTFTDRRYGDGNGYIKSGFDLITTTKPGYIYLDSNCEPAGSRIKFQKHKLPNMLQNFDPSLTEAENMFNNGYRRMWDAGHYKFKKSVN